MVDYYQVWEAILRLPVAMNVTNGSTRIKFKFDVSENLRCSCNSSQPFVGCEFNCTRTGLVISATVLDVGEAVSGDIEIMLPYMHKELEVPNDLFKTRAPGGSSVALQSAEQRLLSELSGEGLLSFSVTASVALKAITSFDFVQISKYAPSLTDTVAAIHLTFSALFDMHGQEPITLVLPGFRGAATTFSEILHGLDGENWGAAWYPAQENLVIYLRCAGSSIPAGRQIHLIVPVQVGILLPAAGIDANSTNVVISSPTSPPRVSLSPTIFYASQHLFMQQVYAFSLTVFLMSSSKYRR